MVTCLPSLAAPHLHRLRSEARLGEGGSGVNWGVAQTQTPRQKGELGFAGQAEPRAPVPPGSVEGPQWRCQESSSWESGFLWVKRAHCVTPSRQGVRGVNKAGLGK